MIVSSSGEGFKPIPEGTYVAVCLRVIDLGTQVTTFQGADKLQRKVLVTWEIPEVRVEFDGQEGPALIMKRYTASLSDRANLRKDLEAWRGRRFTDEELKGFDLSALLGKACQVQVIHSTDGQYANINSIMALPKGMAAPKTEGVQVHFDLDNYKDGDFQMVSEKLQAQIQQSPEWKALQGGPAFVAPDHHELNDDIPF
jgi:hypothetical protein